MAETRRPELLKGTLDLMILKTLSLGEAHGYEIARRIHRTSGEVLQAEEGSLYPALHRLAKRGFIASRWKRSELNRKAKFYRLTARGKKRLGDELSSWQVVSQAIERILSARPEDLGLEGAP